MDEDLRHIRRSLTEDELTMLIHRTESGPDRFGMPGPLRSIAYQTAAYTGFRVDEIRSLTQSRSILKALVRSSRSLRLRPRTASRPISLYHRHSSVRPRLVGGQSPWRIGVPTPSQHRQGDPE